jgi:hypothetical protein
MKGYWKILIKSALPLLRSAGEAKKAEDKTRPEKTTLRARV